MVLFGPTNWQGTDHCSWNAPGVKRCAKHDHSKGLISMVHAAGGEIYPLIGGWSLSNAFPPMASSQNLRARFAAQCAPRPMTSMALILTGNTQAMPIMEELAAISKILTHTAILTQYGGVIAITAVLRQ